MKNNSSAEDRKEALKAQIDELREYFKEWPENTRKFCERFISTAKAIGVSPIYIFLDFLVASTFFGFDADHYLYEEQYRIGFLERTRRLSYRRLNKLDKMGKKNASWDEISLIDDKCRFEKEFAEFLGRETHFAPESADDELREFVKKLGKAIAKPINKCCGVGVHILTPEDMTDEKLKELREGEFLVEELIVQHPDMARINPTSVNTIRMITFIDEEGVPHLFDPYIRAGMKGSITDNCAGGGAAYPLDLETGIVVCRGTNDDAYVRHIYHPGTKTVMPGFKVPNYQYAKEMVLKAALKVPNMRFIGWDVAITENGAVLVESNTFPGTQETDGIARWKEAKRYFKRAKRA